MLFKRTDSAAYHISSNLNFYCTKSILLPHKNLGKAVRTYLILHVAVQLTGYLYTHAHYIIHVHVLIEAVCILITIDMPPSHYCYIIYQGSESASSTFNVRLSPQWGVKLYICSLYSKILKLTHYSTNIYSNPKQTLRCQIRIVCEFEQSRPV